MEIYPAKIECVDTELDTTYFRVAMFDESSAVINSDVCIGSIEELDEYLANIRKAFIQMFPQWDEVAKTN